VRVPLDFARRGLRRARGSLRRLAPRRVGRTCVWLWQVLELHLRLRREAGLRVAVDVDPLWLPLTGVGWYLRLLLEELRDEPGLRIRLYGPWLQGVGAEQARPSQPLPTGTALELVSHPLDDDLSLPPGWQNLLLRLLQPLLVLLDRNEVVFAPNFIVPRRLRWARGALVVTVHDLAMRKFPWTLSDGTRELLEGNLDAAIRRAQHIITPSVTVREEILQEGIFAADRVHAVLHGPGHLVSLRDQAESAGAAPEATRLPPVLLDERGGVLPYAVHVGTIEPRKNLALLLDVWEEWVAQAEQLGQGNRIPRLVWCGGVGWKSDELLIRAERGVEEGWLVRPGYVPDQALEELYARSLCVVMPSHYEGFGLPLVEAMAAGAPVLCSDIPVFREVAGEAAWLLPPTARAWIDALVQLQEDPQVRRRLVAAGTARVAELDWRRCAEQTVAVWRRAAGGSD
jgi:alpha-1,3-rhamnosyl/mannosyltransferase